MLAPAAKARKSTLPMLPWSRRSLIIGKIYHSIGKIFYFRARLEAQRQDVPAPGLPKKSVSSMIYSKEIREVWVSAL